MSHRLVNLTELRARAERAIARSRERGEPTPADAEQFELSKLIEELRIYQAELEIQNQELSNAQAEINQALAKYRALYENLPLPALLVDALGFIVEVNQLAAEQLGLNRLSSLNRMSVFQLFETQSRTPLYALLQNPGDGLPRSLHNLWLKRGSEMTAPCDVNLIRLASAAGQDSHTLLVLVDKTAEMALRESDHHFRSFTDSSLMQIRATDADQRLNYANGGWLSFTGLTEQLALAGDSWRERLHPGEVGRVLQTFADCFERREVFRMDYRLRRHDGEYRWIRDEGTPYFDSTGRFVGYVDHCLDIHDLIGARQSQARLTGELRLNEERLRLAMEATQGGLWDWSVQTGQAFYSPAYLRMLGYEPEDWGDKANSVSLWVDLLHPDEREAILQRATELLNTVGAYELEFRLRGKDGQYRCISSRGKVVERAEDGAPLRAIGTHVDITERKLMQQALVDKHQELEKITGSMPGAVYEFERTADGRYRMPWASAVGGRLFGLDPLTLKDDIGPLFQRIHPEDLPELQARIEVSAKTLRPFQSIYRLRYEDGTERWLQSNSNPEPRPDSGILWYGYTQDITERKLEEARQAEQQSALRELSERLVKIAARVPGVIYQYRQWPDGSASFPYASEGIRDIYRLTPAEVHDDASPVFNLLHPDDREAVAASIEESARNLTNWRCEYRVCFADGTVRWLFGDSSPEQLADGSVLWHGFITDITERKAVESHIRELNASLEAKVVDRTRQLAQASAAKSEFLAHMSHEIRTPMNAILGFAQVLEREPLNEEHAGLVRHISESGQNLLHIINDILDFSKIEAGQLRLEPAPFVLDSLLGRVADLLTASARQRGIELHVAPPPAMPGRLLGDDLRLQQILVNLTGNAIKFTEQGTVDLVTKPMGLEPRSARLRFEVRDTGIGIGPEELGKLFQPFSQADGSITRRFGGTGLGLSICRRLVELMGGTIGADSVPGQGSIFWFEVPLPLVGDGDWEPEAAKPAPAVPRGPRLSGLRVLVVDDNRMNLLLVEKALQREGVEAVLAGDGQQALEILRARPEYFQAVIMDVQMPVMDGLTATRAIRADTVLRELPVIAFTAGVLPEERQAALDAGVDDFLAKPVDLEQLQRVLTPYRDAAAVD